MLRDFNHLKKRIKVFEYLKNYISNNGFMFLQETFSTIYDEKDGTMNLKENFFPHTVIATLAEWLLVS